MPVFNNASTIRRALDSLLAQTFRDFHLLISDDGSTDGTAAICEDYARRDGRVEVVRQSHNLNYGNFRFLLEKASTSLFMFAAGDDRWHPDYIARMVDALDRDPRIVCAVSRVAFVKNGAVVAAASGTRPLSGTVTENIAAFLAAGDDNSRMYGVFRTDVARRAFPHGNFFGYDWAFSVGTLREGIHIEVPETLMWRDYTEPARYIEYVHRDARGTLSRLFPMLPLTKDLLLRLRIPLTATIARRLAQMNADFHLAYLRRYHPRAAIVSARLVGGLARIAAPITRRAH